MLIIIQYEYKQLRYSEKAAADAVNRLILQANLPSQAVKIFVGHSAAFTAGYVTTRGTIEFIKHKLAAKK